jgi:hypothetical protein
LLLPNAITVSTHHHHFLPPAGLPLPVHPLTVSAAAVPTPPFLLLLPLAQPPLLLLLLLLPLPYSQEMGAGWFLGSAVDLQDTAGGAAAASTTVRAQHHARPPWALWLDCCWPSLSSNTSSQQLGLILTSTNDCHDDSLLPKMHKQLKG